MYWAFFAKVVEMGVIARGLVALGWGVGRVRKCASLVGVVFEKAAGAPTCWSYRCRWLLKA